MESGSLENPVVVDGIVSGEKLSQLLDLQTEYPELDYKGTLDLSTTRDLVELAKDVAAMSVLGGYILVGVDDTGSPTGALNDSDLRPFDEAQLAPMLLRYISEPLELRTSITERDNNRIVTIYVGPNPAGCTYCRAQGQYERNGRNVEVFRAGDVFWRDGTRSVRLTQRGHEQIIERRVARERERWFEEQRQIRLQERGELEAAYAARQASEAPLGALDFELETEELTLAVLELLRRDDEIGLRHLLNDATARARSLVEAGDIEEGLARLLDKLTCLASTLMVYRQRAWFDEIVQVCAQIYSMPLAEGDADRFALNTQIASQESAPRVWLQVIQRIHALGALAVRREDWRAVRQLSLQLPSGLTDYDTNWLRHAVTMLSRASHLRERRDDREIELSLLSLARNQIVRLACLRPDGLSDEDDQIFTSLAQFDVLSNIAAMDNVGPGERPGRVFYTNFARFRQARIQPIVERLLEDESMRASIFTRGDDDLATALATIGELARSEGWRFDGFEGWENTAVGAFIDEHLPDPTE